MTNLFNFGKKPEDQGRRPVERRAIPRWEVRVKAAVSWDDGRNFTDCTVENINMKSLLITLERPLPSSAGALQIRFDEEFTLHVGTAVMRSSHEEGRHCYGVLIVRMRDDDREHLYRYMRRRFPDVMERK